MRREQPLRQTQVARDDLQLGLDLALLVVQRDDARMDLRELAARLHEPRVERVEAEQRAVRPRNEDALVLLQRCRVLRSRQGRPQQQCREEREPKREAALPSTTHGPTLPTELPCGPPHKGECLTLLWPGNHRNPRVCAVSVLTRKGEISARKA